ncbi:MAG: hypothetical protein ACLU71_14240, partial [Blautia hansenii]
MKITPSCGSGNRLLLPNTPAAGMIPMRNRQRGNNASDYAGCRDCENLPIRKDEIDIVRCQVLKSDVNECSIVRCICHNTFSFRDKKNLVSLLKKKNITIKIDKISYVYLYTFRQFSAGKIPYTQKHKNVIFLKLFFILNIATRSEANS